MPLQKYLIRVEQMNYVAVWARMGVRASTFEAGQANVALSRARDRPVTRSPAVLELYTQAPPA